MDIPSLFIGLAIFIGVALAVLLPLRDSTLGMIPNATDSQLQSTHAATLAALRDLDLDFSMGKLAADDYQRERMILLTEGAQTLQDIEKLGVNRRG